MLRETLALQTDKITHQSLGLFFFFFTFNLSTMDDGHFSLIEDPYTLKSLHTALSLAMGRIFLPP